MPEVGVQAHDLAGGTHFRREQNVLAVKTVEGKDGFLDRPVTGPNLLGETEVSQFLARHDFGGKLGQRHANGLADKRDGARGARIDFQHIDRLGP